MSVSAGKAGRVSVYSLRLGDDCLILSQRLSQWSSNAPEIEEDVALTNIALDLLGQARTLLTYAGEVEGRGRGEDDLAYLRSEREFLNCLLVEQPNGDFGASIARQILFSTFQLAQWTALCASTDATLAGVAGKAAKEAAYHRDHAVQWTLRLGDGTEESHARMQAGIDAMWPWCGELFESDDLVHDLAARGVGVDPPTLRPQWDAFVDSVLAGATLARPDTAWAPVGGRRGLHTEAFGHLLAEMQSVHRAFPGARW